MNVRIALSDRKKDHLISTNDEHWWGHLSRAVGPRFINAQQVATYDGGKTLVFDVAVSLSKVASLPCQFKNIRAYIYLS